jgi:hypothetical protein
MRYLGTPEAMIGLLLLARLSWIAVAKLVRALRAGLQSETNTPQYEFEAWLGSSSATSTSGVTVL